MAFKHRTLCLTALSIIILLCLSVTLKTWRDIQPIHTTLRALITDAQTLQVTDRNGYPLSISYQNRWNTYDDLPLYQIPNFLQQAFILSEDQTFYQHSGLDWRACLAALWQNLRADQRVRGASTITEQVVRMIHPRPRTLWSKWIETFEAIRLEQNFKKADILEFYLNQLPYAANRRGVLQAARYYFNRDLTTLSHKEMLALVVLARAPSSFDLYRHPEKINAAILRLAVLLNKQQQLSTAELKQMQQQTLLLSQPEQPVNATHFIEFVRKHVAVGSDQGHSLRTTLDANLQHKVQAIMDERIKSLQGKQVKNAAVVVVDHTTGEILTWVVAGANNVDAMNPIPAYKIDAVTVPRQPGSALKPFLYALALEAGWTSATLIDDSPLAAAVGTGLHRFKNYSNSYYGKITLREALGNSLNIPALRTVQFVGTQRYLDTLHALGFVSLNRDVDVYDEGLALGNGEVTLLELVTGYSALANRGVYRPLRFLLLDRQMTGHRVFSAPAASLIANILADPWARRLEFGANSVLNMPVQTAVKTGTSTDYRDAWVVGFNYRYTVGVWFGNLDHTPMDGVTGATGPALVMRSIFAELDHQKTAPLYLSPKLVREDICVNMEGECFLRTEYFIAGTEPGVQKKAGVPPRLELLRPTPDLQVAIDPRIPRIMQKLPFEMAGVLVGDRVIWILNGQVLAVTDTGEYFWPLQRGKYQLRVMVEQQGKGVQQIPGVSFYVK